MLLVCRMLKSCLPCWLTWCKIQASRLTTLGLYIFWHYWIGSELNTIHFPVLTTLFQSTSFTNLTCKRPVIWTLPVWRSSAVNRSFPVLLLLKKCSFDKKSYVFSTFCSHIEMFRSENSFFRSLPFHIWTQFGEKIAK